MEKSWKLQCHWNYSFNNAIKLSYKDEKVMSAFFFIVVLHHNVSADVLFDVTGTRGRERGEFSNLQGISTTSNGRIVVADSNNQCIQVILSILTGDF